MASPPFTISKKLFLSFFLILVILVLFFVSFNRNNTNLSNAVLWVEHTKKVLQKTENINNKVTEIENNSRSFVITQNKRNIDSFEVSKMFLKKELSDLRQLVSDNKVRQQKVLQLQELVNRRVFFASQLIAKNQKHGFDSAKAFLTSGIGTALSDSIKQSIHSLESEESQLLNERKASQIIHARRATFFIYGLQIFLVLIVGLTFVVVINAFKKTQQAEAELSESREWFSRTLESIGEGVISTDNSCKITYMNPVAEHITGWDSAEAKGKPLEEVFFVIYESSREKAENPVRKAIETKKAIEISNHTALIKKDKNEVPVSDSAAPIFNDTGDLIGAVLVFRNVETERKVERELKEARDRFFRIFDLNPIATAISSVSDGRFLHANKMFTDMIQTTESKIIGKTSIELSILTPEQRKQWIEHLRSPRGKEPIELKFNTAKGETIYALVKGDIMDIEGKECVVTCLSDITDRKKKELEVENLNAELAKSVEQQKALNKELESFSYSVSHDLRAPLRSIDGYTRILQEDYGPKLDAEANRLMNTIMNNAQKMNKLIDDLLSFSRLGKQNIEKTDLDMNVIFQSIINEVKGHGEGQKTDFELKPLLHAQGDRNLITQVVINLISNAVKYSSKKENPRVEIGSYEEGDMHVYYIKDNGAGFDMTYYDKLFGIFQRLHSPSEFEGTGVGLAIVQRIINRHHGRVWAESKVNEGATFYFSLPIKN